MPFSFKRFDDLPEVVLVEPRVFGDDRGAFMETYKRSEFEAEGISHAFVQDNHSRTTRRGVLRGLHYQTPPAAQGKLVRCSAGEVFDVAVDVRSGSPTRGRWVSAPLSAVDHRMLWVPPGFAHGFQTLTDVAEVQYKVTHEYSPDHDRGLRWDDPDLGITWPIADPVLSPKDADAPRLRDVDTGFTWKGDDRP